MTATTTLRRRPDLARRAHRFSGAVLAAYALPHLFNHLLAVGGIERHIAFMNALRRVVRLPAVEALLLACVAWQVASGLALLLRRHNVAIDAAAAASAGLRRRAQAISGGYLAFFLLVHVGAVLNARLRLNLDTNFHFAAAGLNAAPYALFFVPYYGAAIVALAVHLVCALRLRGTAAVAGVATGALLAIVIVATFAGALYPVPLPPPYLDALRLASP